MLAMFIIIGSILLYLTYEAIKNDYKLGKKHIIILFTYSIGAFIILLLRYFSLFDPEVNGFSTCIIFIFITVFTKNYTAKNMIDKKISKILIRVDYIVIVMALILKM